MKRIISLLLTIILVGCFFNLFVLADEIEEEIEGASKYFNTDIEIKLDEEKYEIGKSAKFRMDFPQFKNDDGDFLFANDTVYTNVFLQVVSVSDTNGILNFGRTVDYTYTFYESFFAPKDSGETQLVVEFQTYGFNEYGEEVLVEGPEWQFSVIGKTIKVEEIEVESGYFENSSEETFDINEFYKQENAQKNSSDAAVSSEGSGDLNKGNGFWLISLIVILSIIILVAVIFFVNKIKKNKK